MTQERGNHEHPAEGVLRANAEPQRPLRAWDRERLLSSGSAVLAGLLLSVSFLRFDLYPVAWFALVPLLVTTLQAPSSAAAARLGWLGGVATNLPGFYWLVYTIHVFGGFPYVLAAGVYALLTAFTSLQFAAFAWFAHNFRGLRLWALAVAAAWVSLEYWFPNLFPWRLANSQMHAVRLIQSGDVAGPYLLSFAMVWFAAGLAAAWQERRFLPLLGASALVVGLWCYGWYRLPQVEAAIHKAPAIRVALVQGNVGIAEKGDVRYFDVNLEKYRQLSRAVQHEVDLLVWPETVHQEWIPAEAQTLAGKENPFPELATELIFGGLAYRFVGAEKVEQLNSAFWMQPGGRLSGRYDKRILMPFGEYIPGGELVPAVYALSPATGRLTAGQEERVFALANGARVGQLICFEDIVGTMPRKTTRAGANVLVTILNDAWYGKSAAPYQHQALAIWRAIENRRYLLRGSNTGVTSIIDAAGRVRAEGGLFTEEVVTGEAKLLEETTLYRSVGEGLPWAASVATAAAWFVIWRRRRTTCKRPGARTQVQQHNP